MILTIWRHGEAGHAAYDFERTLTDQGFDDVGYGTAQFHKHCAARDIPHPDHIRFSPWVRTRQTADLLCAAFTHADSLEDPRVQPGADIQDAMQSVQEVLDGGEVQHLVLVSHQPLVSRFVDCLLGEAGRVPPLNPGGAVVVDLDIAAPGLAELRFWSFPPDYETGV